LRIQAFQLAADSVAGTTQQSYKSAWKKWISFIDTYSNGPFTDKTLRQLSAHQLLEYLVMFVSYCAYDLQCNVRSIPSIMSAVRKGILLRFVNCDVFDSDLLKAVKQGAARLPAPAHRIRLPCTLDMITHIVQQNTKPPSTTFQFMLATGISIGFYLCLRCSEYISKTIVPLEDPHQFLSSDVQFMLNDGSQTLIDSNLVQHHHWHQIKLVKFSLQHAKNIRRAYGVPIWFSARTPAGQDVPFVRLLYHWSQHSPRHRADPFLSYRTANGLTCLLYADIKKAIKASATIFGLDETWFDTHSVRMSAPTIARATNASPTVIQHMGRWQTLPAAMKYQQQSTRLNDSVLTMVSDPTLFTAEDVRLTQLLASRTSSTPIIRRF